MLFFECLAVLLPEINSGTANYFVALFLMISGYLLPLSYLLFDNDINIVYKRIVIIVLNLKQRTVSMFCSIDFKLCLSMASGQDGLTTPLFEVSIKQGKEQSIELLLYCVVLNY